MDVRRLRVGEWVAGLGGVALLGVMFLGWYGGQGTERTATAWEAFGLVDLVLAAAAVGGIATALLTAIYRTAAVPIAVASITLLVALVGLLLLVWRVADVPGADGGTREIGLWLGLGACLALGGGALASMRDERFPAAARAPLEIETLPPPGADAA